MRQAFSLIELTMTIALAGAMAMFATFYINTNTISKENTKLELQSHINLITGTIFKCKNLSNMMPIQTNGDYASSTLLNTLECNTSTPYNISFIPRELRNFTPYIGTQTGTEFYFSSNTTNPLAKEVLEELNATYSATQYELEINGDEIEFKFYLSR